MRTFLRFIPFAGALWLFAGCESTVIVEGGKRGSDEVCGPFHDVTESTPVTFRFRNEAGVDLYLVSLCEAPGLDIEGPDGSIYLKQAAGHCLQTCEELRSEPLRDCADEDESRCSAPWSFVIPAGGTRDFVWPGTTVITQAMPEACWDTADYWGLCAQLVPMPHGTLKLYKDVWSTCEGDCTCEDSGLCRGSPSGVKNGTDMLEFQYPDDDGIVDVVFDACTFGCAGG